MIKTIPQRRKINWTNVLLYVRKRKNPWYVPGCISLSSSVTTSFRVWCLYPLVCCFYRSARTQVPTCCSWTLLDYCSCKRATSDPSGHEAWLCVSHNVLYRVWMSVYNSPFTHSFIYFQLLSRVTVAYISFSLGTLPNISRGILRHS